MNRDSERKSTDQLAFEHYLRTGQRMTAAEWLAEERKFNPYHDPENGRFTFARGGRTSSASSASLTSRPTNGKKPYPARAMLRAIRNHPSVQSAAVEDDHIQFR